MATLELHQEAIHVVLYNPPDLRHAIIRILPRDDFHQRRRSSHSQEACRLSRLESLRIDTRAENAVTRDSLAGSTETHRPNPLRGGNIALRRHEAEYCTYRHRAIVGPDQAVPHTLRLPKRCVAITCDRTEYRLITV